MGRRTFYIVFKTPAGWVAVLGSSVGLRRITLPQTSRAKALASLGENLEEATISPDAFKNLVERMQSYFYGRRVDFPDKLDLAGATAFQRRVWQATGQIPYGETRSYAWIARQIGTPGAARAVGRALGKNPLPIVIPCHRVLKSDGSLGGFTGGLAMKKRLLALEKEGSI